MIGVIDYKAGNAPSVLNALRTLNIKARLVSTPEALDSVTGLILPGVGSARATMDSLRELGLIPALEEKVFGEKTPFLGICIGMQILMEYSAEGDTPCLGWLKGRVDKFDGAVRIPQMGWNKVTFQRRDPVLAGLPEKEFFYFVNSYYVRPEAEEVVLATTHYGREFCSMLAWGPIYATQFHTEKSGAAGLQLLKNFASLAGGGRSADETPHCLF
ncbi:MAG: imidazole glycerol phosphate synthase subunit HisH [Firmicutes bacterium]|nr:imidazole glycerol phosphate synthase subunit HisH [Bacillota bacterium]